MLRYFDTMKGQAVAALVVFLAVSHLLALLVYARMSEDANHLLHDAHVAEQIATIAKLIEAAAPGDGERIISLVDAPNLHVAAASARILPAELPEGTRGHNFEHLLSAILHRPLGKTIGLSYQPGETVRGLKTIWGLEDAATLAARDDLSHVPQRPLDEIRANGTVHAEILLRNGTWLRFAAPLLSVNPFSTWKFGASLLVGLLFVTLSATWVMVRWTEPLTAFARAAERFGDDINTPALSQRGPVEVRAAAQAFNRMQEQLRQLVEERTRLAAAIAHDLGTPVTRLRLRAEEIEDKEQRDRILDDLIQMQRMIGATLDFARQDVAVEPIESLDLSSLLHSLRDEFSDMHQCVNLDAPDHCIAKVRPHGIRRALTNVIDNAVKYGKRAYIRLIEGSGGQTIIVDDDGPGVPESMHVEIFKPFHRLEQPGQSSAQGTGLGLTVAQTIMRDHGGDIQVMNRPAGGLRVVMTLPRTSAAKAA